MPDTPPPPPIGFLPAYMGSYQNTGVPPQYISGASLSYPMPQQTSSTYSPSSEESYQSPTTIIDANTNSNVNISYFDYFGYDLPGYSWQHISADAAFPTDKAVRAGRDSDGSIIYAGRSFHEGDMLPAKVIPDKGTAYISYGGEEIAKDDFEILRSGDFVWEFATNGEVPEGAIEAGRTADGEKLYFGRCLHEGTQTPGKVQPSHGCLYIPFNGEEVSHTEYEVLVLK